MVQYGFIKNNCVSSMAIPSYYLNVIGTTIINSTKVVPIGY